MMCIGGLVVASSGLTLFHLLLRFIWAADLHDYKVVVSVNKLFTGDEAAFFKALLRPDVPI